MRFFKKLIPNSLLKAVRPLYHGTIAWFGSMYFGRPSEKLIVIGVTGTNGKSTTVNLIAKILQHAGKTVGHTSTVTLNINGQEKLNNAKMTMPSGWLLQKWMREMLNNGCQYAVVEVSSEGLAQSRHKGINFDAAVFTNLTPEHLEAHGGFENYKRAKAKLFECLSHLSHKSIASKTVPKIIVTNSDDANSEFYSKFSADKHFTYGVKNSADFQASAVQLSPQGISFSCQDVSFNLNLKGQFDVYNALAAVAATASQGVSLSIAKTALEKIKVVPGRVEVVQDAPFSLVVDYAYEPEEMRQLYETVNRWPHKRVLQVLGPCGGGRDKARIAVLGEMAAKFADIVFVTTDDPYDDDPKTIIHQMADAAVSAGKVIGQTLFREPDRRKAIARALSKASAGDLVLITGKGADQKIAVANGKYIDWDDRRVAKEELSKIHL